MASDDCTDLPAGRQVNTDDTGLPRLPTDQAGITLISTNVATDTVGHSLWLRSSTKRIHECSLIDDLNIRASSPAPSAPLRAISLVSLRITTTNPLQNDPAFPCDLRPSACHLSYLLAEGHIQPPPSLVISSTLRSTQKNNPALFSPIGLFKN